MALAIATPDMAYALPTSPLIAPTGGGSGTGLIVGDHELYLPAPAGHAVVNGSIGRLGDMLAIVYRVDSVSPQGKQRGQLVMVQLDRHLQPMGTPSLLETRLDPHVMPTAEDPRLIEHEGTFFVAYNSTDNGELRKTRRDMYLLEIGMRSTGTQIQFYSVRRKRMLMADGARQFVEKNWTPFSHRGQLHFVYTTNPPHIGALSPDDWQAPGDEVILRAAGRDTRLVADPLGSLRGGTPALKLPGEPAYLSFHHTFMLVGRTRSAGKYTALYMAGAYTFDDTPPFAIREMTYVPIVPPSANDDADLVTDKGRKLGWITYPTGVIADGDRYYVSYSQNDIRVRLLTIDAKALRNLMRPVANPNEITR